MDVRKNQIVLGHPIINYLNWLRVGKILQTKSPASGNSFDDMGRKTGDIENGFLVVFHQGAVHQGNWISLVPTIKFKIPSVRISLETKGRTIHLLVDGNKLVEKGVDEVLSFLVVQIVQMVDARHGMTYL